VTYSVALALSVAASEAHPIEADASNGRGRDLPAASAGVA